MEAIARWLWRRLGRHYFTVLGVWEWVSAVFICAGTVGILSIYTPMSHSQYAAIVAFGCACIAAGLVLGFKRARKTHAKPLFDWMRGPRGHEGAVEAWRAAIALPLQFVSQAAWLPLLSVAVPSAAFITWELHLPAISSLAVLAGTIVSILYATILHFFLAEVALRPVLADLVALLPEGFSEIGGGVPLRWKLLGSLPLINVITGVTVAGLSTRAKASLAELGLDVVVAVIVAFTISFELTILLTRSILTPVRDLLRVTERVKHGDLSARATITASDEIGELAHSFNQMMTGLQERERLQSAFGSYVDPEVAERVLAEGELLEGEDVEVTVLFVDIRGFTEFAERASARETVAKLNEFFDLVVPIISRHGGHANKFIGDGVLGVVGAPERHHDHADRALSAACDIADAVDDHYDGELAIGIGLNSGPVSVGSVGGGGRLEFTVIGDTVNVAARVERETRTIGDAILLTEATRALLGDEAEDLEPRGEAELRGKSEPIALYTPAGRPRRVGTPGGAATASR